MDDFLVVLGVTAVILVALAAFLGTNYLPQVVPAINYSIAEFSLGTVGFTSSAPLHTTPIGNFIAGNVQAETSSLADKKPITANIFGGERLQETVNIDKSIFQNVEKLNIDFDVVETNQNSNLVVKWNGKEIFSQKVGEGHQKIPVDKTDVKKANTLEISTSGSILFWATTVYNLENVKVEYEYGNAKIVPFELADKELENLDRAELSFFVSDKSTTGSLIIKVDGQTVFDRFPSRIERVNFTQFTAPLKAGTNTLSFIANNGLFELEDARLEIFSLASGVLRKRTFDLAQDKYNALDTMEGVLEFKVDKIIKQGSLNMQLNDKLFQLSPSLGWNNLTFSKLHVKTGMNTLEVTGSGTFEIGDVRIRLVK